MGRSTRAEEASWVTGPQRVQLESHPSLAWAEPKEAPPNGAISPRRKRPG